jgi:cardiolipin synthase
MGDACGFPATLQIFPMAIGWFSSLPNFITLGRLLLTPVAITLVADQSWRLAFAVFVIAGVSDAIDGWLAKTFNLQSELGAVLDPIADKALIVSIYVALAIAGALPRWLSIMVVSRDIMIIGGIAICWLMSRPMPVRPHPSSKATTAAQIALAGVALAGRAYGVGSSLLDSALILAVAALTATSAAVYLWLWVKHMRP